MDILFIRVAPKDTFLWNWCIAMGHIIFSLFYDIQICMYVGLNLLICTIGRSCLLDGLILKDTSDFTYLFLKKESSRVVNKKEKMFNWWQWDQPVASWSTDSTMQLNDGTHCPNAPNVYVYIGNSSVFLICDYSSFSLWPYMRLFSLGLVTFVVHFSGPKVL